MLRPENRELREERGRVANQMQQLTDRTGLKTKDDKDKFEALDAEQKRLKDRIDLVEGSDRLYRELRTTGRPPADPLDDIVSPSERDDKEYSKEYRIAFRRYLRRGRAELSVDDRAILQVDKMELRDMITQGGGAYPGGSGATGGFFVPTGFVQDVEEALKYYGPMLDGGVDMPTIMDTATGAPLPYPTSNDTGAMGELIGESQEVSTEDVNIGMVMFGAWKFSTKLVKVSLELIEDSAFDIENFLIRAFAERIGRAANQYLTTGLGAASMQPSGIIRDTLAGGLAVTAAGASANDGVSGLNTIGSDDLVNLEHQVDPLYRPGAKYMMHDSTLKALKHVKDKYGRPLWQQGMRDGQPDTVNGYQYAINSNMDQLQTVASSPLVTRNTVLFGALKKYVVRRVKNLSVLRLTERFAEYGQVGFIGFYRADGHLLDAGTHPTAILQNIY